MKIKLKIVFCISFLFIGLFLILLGGGLLFPNINIIKVSFIGLIMVLMGFSMLVSLFWDLINSLIPGNLNIKPLI